MLLAAVTQTADEGFRIHDILRAVSGALEVPVIVLLVLFLLAAAALVGWLISESCTERRHLKLALPALMETLRTASDREAVVEESGLLRRQKDALLELLRHPDFTDATREALAIELLEREQDRYDSIVKLSELLARLAPMLGLLGTLIPLGPGIIALGQGDTYTLSTSLLTAFDTTIAGLVAAALAIVVSAIRRRWYREYGSVLEALCTEVLELTKKIVAENHITCLMITHNIPSALSLGNRTIMMNNGRIALELAGAERENMTTEQLLKVFHEQGVSSDRILFSAES